MKKARKEDGTWVEGPASPELLPKHMRAIPSDWVTKDSDDPDRIHADDASHIVSSLAKEKAKHKAEKADVKAELDKLWAPGPGERAPITQWFVDVARTRVGMSWLRVVVAQLANAPIINAAEVADAIVAGERIPDLEGHLIFPDPHNVNEYVFAHGVDKKKNSQKHKKLRGIDTNVTPFDPPKRVIAVLAERGIDYNPRKAFAEAWLKSKALSALEI